MVLLSGLTGAGVSVASWVRLVAGFGGIVIVVVTGAGQRGRRGAVGGRGILRRADPVGRGEPADGQRPPAGRPNGRQRSSVARGGTVLLLIALPLGELDPARWSDVSWTSAGAAVFLLVFDSLPGFMPYTTLLESAPASLVSTYAYVTPLVGAVIGATVLDEPLWAGAFAGGFLVLGAVALELHASARTAC